MRASWFRRETCANILKSAGEAAAAAKVKFVAPDAGDGPVEKKSKAAAAGFDDAKAATMEMVLRKSSSSMSAASLEMKVTGQMPPPPNARNARPQVVQIGGLSVDFDQQPIWVLYIQPFARQMFDAFYERMVGPPPR